MNFAEVKMVSAFTSEAQVLSFRPRAHVRPGGREYLLWPALAYRVVAPQIRQRQLNILQRAVMGLCRAGVLTAERVGENLALHIDLSAFIMSELADLEYLDTHGCPTPKGLRVLESDEIETQDMVAGYVFQDPWNGELWPRFVERLDYCNLEYDAKGFPSLLLGSIEKPWRQGAFMVLPGNTPSPTRPSPANVIAAVSGHRRALRYADSKMHWNDEDEQLGWEVGPGTNIKRVSFVDEEPDPIYLMTYLYLPKDSDGISDWYACDPFGLGAGVRLRRRVEQIMQKIHPLYEVVDRLVGRVINSGIEEQKRWIEDLRTKAAMEVEQRLTVNIRLHPAFEQIVDMEVARLEAELLGTERSDSRFKLALRECVKVLEAVFGEMTTKFPLKNIWKRVYVSRVDQKTGERYLAQQQDKQWLAETYRAAARTVGFEDPVPEALLNVRPGHIKSVAEYSNSWRLRPLICATILLAQMEQHHPMWDAARRHPKFLQVIDEVAERGGMAGHANEEASTQEETDMVVEKVYTLVAAITGLKADNETEMSTENGEDHGQK
jgi:hypothetical protein